MSISGASHRTRRRGKGDDFAVNEDRARHRTRMFGYALMAPALVAMAVFFVGAMVILFVFSLRPFEAGITLPGVTSASYVQFVTGGYYWGVVLTTVKLGAITTLLALIIGYPTAYAIAQLRRPQWKSLAYFALFSPLLTSVIVRSYGWSLVLGDHGLINGLLMGFHVERSPLHLLYELSGVTISLLHILLPFMALPIIGVLGQVDASLREASRDLGASPLQTFFRVTLPLTIQGAVVGCQLVFALAISAFATPALLGGGRVQVLATLIYNDFGQLDWPIGSVESFALLILALISIGIFTWLLRRVQPRQAGVVGGP